MKYIYYLSFVVLFYSCSEDYPEYLGSSLNDQFGELAIVDSLVANSSTFDFSDQSSKYFSARWSKNLQWVLTITGTESGAVKTFTGFDNKIDIDNTQWIGTADDFPSFSYESCVAELTLDDNENTIVLETGVTISELKALQEGMVVVADFDNGYPQNYVEFAQSGESMNFNINYGGAAQGEGFYSMGGIVNWDYYLGSLKIASDISSLDGIPSSLFYFNMAVIGGQAGQVPADQVIKIIFREDDNETYVYEINPVNWSEWRLSSIPYDDFELEGNATNNQRDPSSITLIEVMCLSCPAGPGPIAGGGEPCTDNENLVVKTNIDYITFTINEPYQP